MKNIEQLLQIMSSLRDPEFGCAWDLKQSFQSITPHTLEEVYEVIECIETKNYEHLPNELGDLLFQVVFLSQIGKDRGMFDFNDVVSEISEKLLTRHPHVFPDATLESFGTANTLTPKEVEKRWEEIKTQEKLHKLPSTIAPSVLDDVPGAFPALLRAKKLQKKASSIGFDWFQVGDVLAKLKEEVEELEEAIAANDEPHIKEEFGDVLFSVVNLSRHLNVDSESCLRSANKKFEARFRLVELMIEQDGEDFSSLSLMELEEYWQKAKTR